MPKINTWIFFNLFLCIACTPTTKDNLKGQPLNQTRTTSEKVVISDLQEIDQIPFDTMQITLTPISPTATTNNLATSTNNLNVAQNSNSHNTTTNSQNNITTDHQSNTDVAKVINTNVNTNTDVNTNTNVSSGNTSSSNFDIEVADIDNLPETITNKVLLRKGSYFLDRSIKIEAQGFLKIEKGTILEMDASGITCLGKIEIKGSADSPVIIKGIAWDNIVVMDATANGTFEYCNISGGSGMGVRTDGLQFFIAPDNIITTFGSAILFLNAKGKIKNCTFSNSYGNNLLSFLFSDVSVEDSTIEKYNEIAMYTFGGKVVFSNNTIKDQTKAAMVFYSGSNAVIQNNTFTNCESSVIAQDKSVVNVKNNTFEACFSGIAAGFVSDVVVEKNTFTNMRRAAVSCRHQCKIVINENKIEKSPYGIELEEKCAAKINKNTIKLCQVGILKGRMVTAEIKDNVYEKCGAEEITN